MDWSVPLVTFAGVFAAYYLGVQYDRKKKRAEDKEKMIKAKNILYNELAYISDGIKGLLEMYKSKGLVPVHTDYPDYALWTVINSGDFSLLDLKTQMQVSHTYAIISRVRRYRNMLISLLQSEPLISVYESNENIYLTQVKILYYEKIPKTIPLLRKR